jgi:hypothetical protein
MKLEFITGYLSENQRNTGSLDIYYDFSGISGFFVPNRLYGNQTQFNKIGGGFTANSEYHPGIFVSCYQQSGFTGSGIFEGTNNLKVLNQLSGNNLSLFYNFGALNCNKNFSIGSKQINIPTGQIQVLSYIESANSNNNPFEMILGLNDAYKLTLEFSGKINNSSVEKYKLTNVSELSFQNIGTLRLNDKNVEFTYFDIIEDEIYNRILNLTGSYFNQDKNIYIGNIPTGKYRNGYTGFIGIVDDFVAFDEYFDANFCAGFSRLFIKTGDGIETLNLTGVKYNIIQSGFLNPTGILGTGITGYQIVPSNEIINSSCGDNCVVYVQSGVTGLISGEKIEYRVVGQEEYATIQKQIKYNLYDQNYAARFTKDYIVFTPQLDSKDIFNIQLYKDVDTKVEIPDYAILSKNYLTQDTLTDRNLLIFFNGVNISSGSYQIIGSDTRFIIDNYDKDSKDFVSYSLSSFSSIENYLFNFDNDNPATGDYIFITNLDNKKYDTFLNGQKLINGLDYVKYNKQTQINGDIEFDSFFGNADFGNSVAASNINDRIIIGSPYEDPDTFGGAAYVFQKSGLKWNKISKIIPNNLFGDDFFGNCVAINNSGNLAAIGAVLQRYAVNARGAFYIATGNSNSWSTGAYFTGRNSYSNLGYDININGLDNQIIVSAIQDGVNTSNMNGAIHIYTGDKINWKIKKSITGDQHLSFFGNSIATNYAGNIIAVGAPNFSTGAFGTYAVGKLYIYTGDQNDFALAKTFTGIGTSTYPTVGLGSSCALNKNGNIALIGAPNDRSFSGSAFIYTGDGNNWVQKAKITGLAQNSYFGYHVDLNDNGDTAAISAFNDNGVGAIYIFTGQNENWTQIKKIQSLNPTNFGEFGKAFAWNKNENNLFITTKENSISGRAYIYEDFLNDQTNSLYLNKNLPDGTLYITQDNFDYEVTGSNLKLYHSTENYNNERIWLNGIFQNKNENYLLTSCINTILQATGDIEVKNESIFNNEYYRFI